MDQVICELSKIEAAAEKVLTESADEKKYMAADMERQISEFDRITAEKTEKTLLTIQASMNKKLKTDIEKLQCEGDKELSKLEDLYEKKHSLYAQGIFDNLIKEV